MQAVRIGRSALDRRQEMETVIDRLWSGVVLADQDETKTKAASRMKSRPSRQGEAEFQARYFALKA